MDNPQPEVAAIWSSFAGGQAGPEYGLPSTQPQLFRMDQWQEEKTWDEPQPSSGNNQLLRTLAQLAIRQEDELARLRSKIAFVLHMSTSRELSFAAWSVRRRLGTRSGEAGQAPIPEHVAALHTLSKTLEEVEGPLNQTGPGLQHEEGCSSPGLVHGGRRSVVEVASLEPGQQVSPNNGGAGNYLSSPTGETPTRNSTVFLLTIGHRIEGNLLHKLLKAMSGQASLMLLGVRLAPERCEGNL